MAKPTKKIPGWKLVWHDEFDGDQIDRTKWDFDIGNGFFDYRNHAWVPGWGNEELQYYTDAPANASVKDSLLTIRAQKESLHGCGYTSARLKTRRRDGTPLFTTLYGRVEFRAKVPWGKGLWPALWMLPQDDQLRRLGRQRRDRPDGDRRREAARGAQQHPLRLGLPASVQLITQVHPLPGGSTVTDWHVYAVEWEPGEIRFYVDDVHTCTYNHWWSCSRLEGRRGRRAARRRPT